MYIYARDVDHSRNLRSQAEMERVIGVVTGQTGRDDGDGFK